MKVLHLGAGNLYGGVETFLVTLARMRSLAPEMQSEFGLCFSGRLYDELMTAGVPVHHLGEVRLSRPWTVWRARKRLQQLLGEREPDVVVIHSGMWGYLAFANVVRTKRIRLAIYAHNPPDRPTGFDRWAARIQPDLVIANSKFTAASVPLLFPKVRTEVAYLPVQQELPEDRLSIRADLRAKLGVVASDTVIVTTCRLEKWKGHTLLLEALGRLRDQPGWASWIAGGAQRPSEVAYLEELKTTALRLGIAERVKFLGQRSDVLSLLVSADIHCQPNTGPEPFGIAFVEALAAGLPVVTTAMGGAFEVVDKTCGVLTPAEDAAELSAVLGRLMADLDGRRSLGSKGPSRARMLCDPATAFYRFHRTLKEAL